MLENLFTNVFGRPKNKSSGRNSQSDSTGASAELSSSNSAAMTGPFSISSPQMPQPPNLPYPVAPYPGAGAIPQMSAYYPSLPFSQPPSMPTPYSDASGLAQPYRYPTGTIASHVSPLESVPFEAKLTLNSSTNLVNLDQLFREIKKAGDVVDKADAYLRSSQSDYDFKIEQGLIYQ